ncbi:conserved hypothetical protein [Streptomyces lividans TK24]|nr:conserved hypothetical protein [Streptomyces lividans TK24]
MRTRAAAQQRPCRRHVRIVRGFSRSPRTSVTTNVGAARDLPRPGQEVLPGGGTTEELPAEGAHAHRVAQPGGLGAARLHAVPQLPGLRQVAQELGPAPTPFGLTLPLPLPLRHRTRLGPALGTPLGAGGRHVVEVPVRHSLTTQRLSLPPSPDRAV